MRLAVAAVFTLACTPPKPTCPVAAAPVAPEPAPSPVATVTANDPPVTTRGARCWKKGPAKPIDLATKADPYCHPLDKRELAAVEAQLRKELKPWQLPSQLYMDFACDAAGEPQDVFYEHGSGHGGTLELVWFHRAKDRVDVRVIASSHYQNAGLEVKAGSLDVPTFDAAIAKARVWLLARPHFVPLTSTGMGGMTGGMSSHDFHLRLTLVGNERATTDRGFTGYEADNAQERIVPMRHAAEPIDKLLASLKLVVVPAGDGDRTWFTARMAVTLAGQPFWWVRERYVLDAAKLGTIDAVPYLVPLLATTGDASEARTREAAVAAIAAITGWDPRIDPAGKPRSLAAAIAAARAECAP